MKKRYIIIINILIVGLILFIIVKYANDRAMESNRSSVAAFEKMTTTTEQIIANYLEDEQHLCDIWSNYINRSVDWLLLAAGAKWHHERYDGTGYPQGLSGDDIPEEARIIAVADAYDAMTSNRSYRGALPQEVVRREIEKGSGTQFDKKFVDIMLQMIDEDTEYLMRDNPRHKET